VAGVGRGLHHVAPEAHEQWPVQCYADPLENIEVEVRLTAFDAALDHPPDAGTPSKFRPRQAATLTHRTDLAADPNALLASARRRLDR